MCRNAGTYVRSASNVSEQAADDKNRFPPAESKAWIRLFIVNAVEAWNHTRRSPRELPFQPRPRRLRWGLSSPPFFSFVFMRNMFLSIKGYYWKQAVDYFNLWGVCLLIIRWRLAAGGWRRSHTQFPLRKSHLCAVMQSGGIWMILDEMRRPKLVKEKMINTICNHVIREIHLSCWILCVRALNRALNPHLECRRKYGKPKGKK